VITFDVIFDLKSNNIKLVLLHSKNPSLKLWLFSTVFDNL